MGSGMAESDVNIKKYKKNAKALKSLAKKTGKESEKETLKKDLDSMWETNQLHIRNENYMRMHGEGGLYRGTRDVAAPVNEAVTNKFITTAVDLYDGGSNTKALEVLGDALHQAEDRGSHFEGEQGKGHDARQKVNMSERVSEHQQAFNNVPYIPAQAPLPDNSDKNPEGAQLAIVYAENVINTFASGIKSKDKISGAGPRERHAIIKGMETTPTGKGTKFFENNFAGGASGKYLETVDPKKAKGLVMAGWQKEWNAFIKGKDPAKLTEELEKNFAEQEKQDKLAAPQAESAMNYYLEGMVMQGIRDIVRGKKAKEIKSNKDNYLKQLLSEWPAKYHKQVTVFANAQLAKY